MTPPDRPQRIATIIPIDEAATRKLEQQAAHARTSATLSPAARRIIDDAVADLAASLGGDGAVPVYTLTEADGAVTLNLSVTFRAADLNAFAGALAPDEARVLAALAREWASTEHVARAVGLDTEDTRRHLRALKDAGRAWQVGESWRLP